MGRILKKKGQSGTDIIYMVAFLLMFSIAALVGKFAWDEIGGDLRENEIFNSSTAGLSALDAADTANDLWDYIFLVLFIGFMIGMMVIGYILPARPAFMIIYIIVLLVAVLVSGAMSDVYEGVKSTTVFTSLSTPIMDHIMGNFQLYIAITGGLAMIATYAKARQEDGV